jgi:4-amino-4-deoxy-L-arabinose transferase-like glycosyltransferase
VGAAEIRQAPRSRPAQILARVGGDLSGHWAIGVFCVALVLRVTFVVIQLKLHPFNLSFDAGDSGGYREIANSLLNGGHYRLNGHPTAYRTPGYPLFLAGLFELSRGTMFVALCQAILGSATCAVLASASNHLAGRRAAWMAGIISACYPEFVFWTGYVTTETLYVLVIALSLLSLARLIEEPTRSRGLVVGVVLGAAVLVRPIALELAGVLAIYGIARPRWRVAAATAVATTALLLAPWVIRNELVMHTPVITTETGETLYQGDSSGTDAGAGGYLSVTEYKPLHLRGLSEVQQSDHYQSAAVHWILHHPGRVVSLMPHKLWNMWRPTYSHPSTMEALVTYATNPLLVLLGITGLVLERRTRFGLLLIAFVGYHLVFHALVFGIIRFRLPVEAGLVIAAGATVSYLIDRFGRRLAPAAGTTPAEAS